MYLPLIIYLIHLQSLARDSSHYPRVRLVTNPRLREQLIKDLTSSTSETLGRFRTLRVCSSDVTSLEDVIVVIVVVIDRECTPRTGRGRGGGGDGDDGAGRGLSLFLGYSSLWAHGQSGRFQRCRVFCRSRERGNNLYSQEEETYCQEF